jgi:hypothetical protein
MNAMDEILKDLMNDHGTSRYRGEKNHMFPMETAMKHVLIT